MIIKCKTIKKIVNKGIQNRLGIQLCIKLGTHIDNNNLQTTEASIQTQSLRLMFSASSITIVNSLMRF
jgi:hypothetical protein